MNDKRRLIGESPFAHQQQGVPLVALFLLTAIVAMLLAILAIALRSFDFWSESWGQRLLAAIAGAIVMAAIGVVWGLFNYDRLLGVAIGSVVGSIVGVLAAAILFSAENDRRELSIVACVGSVVILGLAGAIRWQSK